MTPWTAVAASLPDDECTVLIAMGDGEVWVGFLDAGVWRNVDSWPCEGTVTHWRHFPEHPVAQRAAA